MSEQLHQIDLMEKIVSLCKRRGFIFQGSEIYGGLAGTWDFGPLGVALKNNIKNSWRNKFITSRDDMYEVDAALIMNPKVWETSGHVGGFADPMVECEKCHEKFRSDHLIKNERNLLSVQEEWLVKIKKIDSEINLINEFDNEQVYFEKINTLIDGDAEMNIDQKVSFKKMYRSFTEKRISSLRQKIEKVDNKIEALNELIKSNKYIGLVFQDYLNRFEPCPFCKSYNWGLPVQFNMMFQTQVGAMEDSASIAYFRPETAQGMFVNFKNIVDSYAPKLPFGMAQIGKAFRNEITPKDFIFRVREFEQMEIEYFVSENNWETEFENLRKDMWDWIKGIGIDSEKVHELQVTGDDLAHYSKATIDFEFDFPFGRKELYGLAYRTDFDLRAHTDASGAKLEYFDTENNEKFIPHCIEPSFGVERTVLALLTSAYREDEQGGEVRSYLAFKPSMAPIKACVSPLLKNRPELSEKAREVYKLLKSEFGNVMYDDNGNVGKRYRRQDEIGTPWCIVVDFDTTGTGDNTDPSLLDTVTIRDRDTGEQQRIIISELVGYIQTRIV